MFKGDSNTMKSLSVPITVFLFACCSTIFIPTSGQSDTEKLVIIVNRKTPIEHITVAEIKRLFLKQRHNWKSGDKAFPINGKNGSRARQLFLEKVLNMTESDEKTYWQDQKVKRGLSPPPSFSNVQKAVFSLKDSIGYCLSSEHKPGTSRVVLTL